jgi:hypothetical protein
VATRDVFSADELAQLRGFPEIGRAELIRFFMLTPADEEFVRRSRDKRNVLGAAVQLCTLPWLGFVPDDVPAAPAAAVARLSAWPHAAARTAASVRVRAVSPGYPPRRRAVSARGRRSRARRSARAARGGARPSRLHGGQYGGKRQWAVQRRVSR